MAGHKRLLRPDQTAERLNVHKRTVYRLCDRGDLVCLRIGAALRVVESSVDRYVDRQIERHYLDTGQLKCDTRDMV